LNNEWWQGSLDEIRFQHSAESADGILANYRTQSSPGTYVTFSSEEGTPIITSDGGGATASINVNENSNAVTTVTSTDPGAPPQTLTYSIIGGTDAAKFSIGSSNGVLSFVSAPNFESPTDSNTDNVYVVTVQVSDGALIDTQTLSITVQNTNDAPVLDNTGNLTLTTITEDQTNNSGQTVASIIASDGGDRITDDDSGAVEGIAITAISNGNGYWQYSINGGSSWSTMFSISGNTSLLLRSTDYVRFVPNGQNATTGSLTFRAWDQTSGTAGTTVSTLTNGGTTAFSSATEVASITVTEVNDAPVFDGQSFNLLQDFGTGYNDAHAVTELADGKFLVAGSVDNAGFAVTRYNADGSVDTSFGGGDGWASIDVGGGFQQVFAMAVQADGKIMLTGQAGFPANIGLARLNADGSVDTGFGGGAGYVITSIGAGNEHGVAVQVLGSGKIVVGATTTTPGTRDYALLQYNSDGTLDTGFGGGDGIVTTAIGAGTDWLETIAVQSDGKIVGTGGNQSDVVVVRWNTDGTLDTSFGGGDGIVTTDVGTGIDVSNDVLLQPDGKIVVGALATLSGNDSLVVLRYNSDGTLDSGFGSGGIASAVPSATPNQWQAHVVRQADGALIVVADQSDANYDYSVVAARFTSSGVLDTSWGGGDGVAEQIVGKYLEVKDAIVTSSGRLLVASWGEDASFNDFHSLVMFGTEGSEVQRVSPSFTEGGAAVALSPYLTVSDVELSATDNFSGATLTLARNGGANASDVFSATGTLASISAASGNVVVGGTTIGTYTNTGGSLVFTFNANATNSLVNSAMQQIAYANSSDAPPSSLEINWTFNDGNTGAQGSGGALQGMVSTLINITPINDEQRKLYK
jgi:uncharacterized delta-60 repeat protein